MGWPCALLSPPQPQFNNPATHSHLQVPEWTKCSNREKRKEKEKPFYSDSEGESGPTESADSGEEMGRVGRHCWSCVQGCVHLPMRTCVCANAPEGLQVSVRTSLPVSHSVQLASGPGQFEGRVCGLSVQGTCSGPQEACTPEEKRWWFLCRP